jgi:hypothetical protein
MLCEVSSEFHGMAAANQHENQWDTTNATDVVIFEALAPRNTLAGQTAVRAR